MFLNTKCHHHLVQLAKLSAKRKSTPQVKLVIRKLLYCLIATKYVCWYTNF